MFNVSLSDRLKAAVNTLEQTGSSLQARAIGQAQSPSSTTSAPSTGQQHQHQAQAQAQVQVQSPGQTPTPNAGPSIARSISPNPKSSTTAAAGAEGIAVSPTRNYSTSQLAENALSGLRKSFQFGRDGPGHGHGHGRTGSGASAGGSGSANGSTTGRESTGDGQQELKDITSPTQLGGSSRSASPAPAPASARFLSTLGGGGSNFALGNDTPSVSVSATSSRPRSPNLSSLGLTNTNTQAQTQTQTDRTQLPPPNPNDPASYPLPSSPTTTTSSNPLLSPVPASAFADPLGASPSITPQVPPDPPVLEMHAPTPDNEPEQAEGEGSLRIITAPTMETEVVQKVEEAAARYEEMSLKYTGLATQIENASKVIKELTPLEGGIEDAEALEGWIRMQNGKVEMITEELKRMQDKLTLQESRMEELRDTHRLEGASQTTLVTKLRSQLSTAESNLASKAGELMQIGQIRADLAKAQTVAKEEEEKRTKAISLLKTVRMKLTKAEKDREEVERDRAEERAERSRAVEELERTKAEREREVNNLRKGFERELAGVKERSERELQAKKAAWELEMITTKASHAKELSSRMTQVSGLEAIVKELNISKQQQFETLESRQTEVETSRAEMERMQNSTKELEYQLREANERCSLLEDQLQAQSSGGAGVGIGGRGRLNVVSASRAGTPSPSPSRQNSNSGIDVQRLLAEAESRAESKMSDLRHKIRSLETERNEVEEEWGNKLQERVRELDKLRRDVRERSEEYEYLVGKGKEKDGRVEEAEERCRVLERELNALKVKMQEAEGDHAASADAERTAREEINNLQSQISTLNTQLDDFRNLTTQLRQTNKTLREEMRKIQSSVQLMERSRNPGVGYWSAGTSTSASNGHPSTGGGGVVPPPSRSGLTSPDSLSMVSTPTKESRRSLESFDTAGAGGRGSPAPSTATTSESKSKTAPANEEEEVNLEYLRNVILQFLENKEMRPNLVRVLSVILRFTPQELRRLNAKLLT